MYILVKMYFNIGQNSINEIKAIILMIPNIKVIESLGLGAAFIAAS